MRRQRTIALAAAMTMLASSIAPMPPLMAQQDQRGNLGFCRQPARLPNLGPETDDEQQYRRADRGGDIARTRAADDRAPTGVPSPPPPLVVASRVDEAAGTTRSEMRGPPAAPSADEAGPAATTDRAVAGVILPPGPVRPHPRHVPPSGLLTAGEHDDLLNPELYARYLARQRADQAAPAIVAPDTSNLLSVVVRDSAGRPVPFADVVLTCSDGNAITLATQGDGRVVFFPAIDRISPRATIRVRYDGRWQGDVRQVSIANGAGSQEVTISSVAGARAPTKLDLMLVVDTTGSMGDEIRYLQSELRAIVSAIHAQHRQLDIRVAFVFYRDQGDAYVTRTYPFDRDMQRVDTILAQQNAAGGGDYPEAMDQALIRAVAQDWRPDAIKSLLLVADAPPHDRNMARTWMAGEAARAKRIHITPVAASGVAATAEHVMRAMAAFTQSRYLFLTDDSGIGNPHAEPAIDCYLVTRLDALIRRVIDSQISGRRIEPREGEVIRTVGQYDAGRCILPPGNAMGNGQKG